MPRFLTRFFETFQFCEKMSFLAKNGIFCIFWMIFNAYVIYPCGDRCKHEITTFHKFAKNVKNAKNDIFGGHFLAPGG